jgi:hypothetical protein
MDEDDIDERQGSGGKRRLNAWIRTFLGPFCEAVRAPASQRKASSQKVEIGKGRAGGQRLLQLYFSCGQTLLLTKDLGAGLRTAHGVRAVIRPLCLSTLQQQRQMLDVPRRRRLEIWPTDPPTAFVSLSILRLETAVVDGAEEAFPRSFPCL